MTVDYLKNRGIFINGIIINSYEDNILCNDNIKMIKVMTNIHVIGVMPLVNKNSENFLEEVKKASEKCFEPKKIIDSMKEI